MSARRAVPVAALLALLVTPPPAAAQLARVRVATFAESYSFDAGFDFRRVNEITVPVGVDFRFGDRFDLTLSSGWGKVTVRSATDEIIQGARDTEVRVGYHALPGRLVVLATGVVPTGVKTVDGQEVTALGILASDVIGFAGPSVGSGGAVGGGFAGAVPLGRFALGFGATYRHALAYEPVLGNADEFRPGAEIRFRTGFEGPLARQTYLRLAGVYALRQKDRVAGATVNGIGNRIVGYVAVSHQVGRVGLNLYGFDVYRADPQLEATPAGTAFLPRGNLLAGGVRIAIPVTEQVVFTPRGEYRLSASEPDTNVALRKAGETLRFGFDLRYQVRPDLAAVFQLGRVTGTVTNDAGRFDLRGTRAALHLELTP